MAEEQHHAGQMAAEFAKVVDYTGKATIRAIREGFETRREISFHDLRQPPRNMVNWRLLKEDSLKSSRSRFHVY